MNELYRSIRWVFSILLLLSCILTCFATIPLQKKTWPTRNYPGQIGFPSYTDIGVLINQIDGKHLSPFDPAYANASLTNNLRVLRTPGFIFFPVNVRDIQKIVTFAAKHNVHLCIRSSGHSYIGRSTHGGCIVLDMVLMKSIRVNLTSSRNKAGEVEVQSGAKWIEVYEKLNSTYGPDATGTRMVGRVIVGGSAHTVAMGGYTQGGGHAPICRRFGLAVDNVLEVTLITADGKLMTLTSKKTVIHHLDGLQETSKDTSLFWAVRGGGGGTWGVVVSFTYKLHYAPERFRNLILGYPLFSAEGSRIYEDSVRTALSEIGKLSEDWGGYVITSTQPVASTPYTGMLLVFLNHYGNDSLPSNSEVKDLLEKTKPIFKSDINYPHFLDYELTAKDPAIYNTYIANTFIPLKTMSEPSVFTQLVDFLYQQANSSVGCTFTMIGGSVMKSNPRPATPVHPAFRNGLFSASCGVGWNYNPVLDPLYIQKALAMTEQLYKLGKGSYFNEPAEDMDDWKTRFWADQTTYERLLSVKKKYDPDNYFWCHNCVGSDLGTAYGPPARSTDTTDKQSHKRNPKVSVSGFEQYPTVARAER